MKVHQVRFWRMAVVLLSFAFITSSCDDDDDDVVLPDNIVEFNNVSLTGSAEVPAVTTNGSGTLDATYDKDTNILTYDINWTLGNANDNTTGIHFHGPAVPTENAGVVVPLTGFPSGSSGNTTGQTRVLTEAEEQDLLNGRWYLNIHSTTYPNGELRGNLIR